MSRSRSKSMSRSRTKKTAPAPAKKGGSGSGNPADSIVSRCLCYRGGTAANCFRDDAAHNFVSDSIVMGIFLVAEVARHGWFATDKELLVRCSSCRENLSLALPPHDSGVRQTCIGRRTGRTVRVPVRWYPPARGGP